MSSSILLPLLQFLVQQLIILIADWADLPFCKGFLHSADRFAQMYAAPELTIGFIGQKFGVKPDILTMAKGIGNGIPVGAFAMTEKVAQASLKPGDHGATYGGNPLACMAVKTVIDIFEEEKIVEHVNEVSEYLTDRLEELVQHVDGVLERKGTGLMQGIVLKQPVAQVNNRAIEEGLLVIQAQGNVLRLVPPLIIEKEHVDEMIPKLTKALTE